jgi:hypothetical protein
MGQRFGSHSASKCNSHYMYNRKDNKDYHKLAAVCSIQSFSRCCPDVVLNFALLCRRLLVLFHRSFHQRGSKAQLYWPQEERTLRLEGSRNPPEALPEGTGCNWSLRMLTLVQIANVRPVLLQQWQDTVL